MKVENYINEGIKKKGALYFILIDPDKLAEEKIPDFINHCNDSGVDGFLVGGSLMITALFDTHIKKIKNNNELPVIIFPGSTDQVSSFADAILYISLVSSRNPEYLIGKHVLAAPIIKHYGIETIPTGYILVESGKVTTAEYMSGSKSIPRNKPEIAAATALAAQYLGMKYIYLEGGSGAQNPVPDEMIKFVSSYIDIPVIVGGGIIDVKTALNKVDSGARIIVTGNHFENEENWESIKEFANAIHSRGKNESN